MRLNEDFLHYIWQYRLLTSLDLYCTNGSKLEIIDPGAFNTHAGPDFSTAKLRIGGTLWAGNVEIHLRASDWLLHDHQEDRLYDTVILHVVYEDDAEICRTDGSVIPVLLVKELIPESLLQRYRSLLDNRNAFPCEHHMPQTDPAVSTKVLATMAAARLAEKSAELESLMLKNKYNWNETFHQLLIRNFGFKVNNIPFEMMAAGLPATLFAKHRHQPLQIEALLFGQSGFLEGEFTDLYPRQLQAEYIFLRKKYQLQPLDSSLWKFLRMRPQNFPLLRIAQLAGMLSGNTPAIADVLAAGELSDLLSLFVPVAVHPYWTDHDQFDQQCKPLSLMLGKRSVELLIINAVCVILYHYGWYFGLPAMQQRALSFLQKIPAEHNAVTQLYKKSGLTIQSAWDSQGVLQLHHKCCMLKKCLSCPIGMDIVTKPVSI
ncbi:DUF2851 family protein [Pedobacter sp. MC2016-15]|uniref:DUF2851 family protein n=1 Tax=Pedobacter sp. MC2016-15 TaxID=2994473 RepID=UPI0022460550|nr:DUF2851 family protein [Pedobacter sp. MC2016-15]MCX2479568.1 DUF2851 family protein [Pedobacter sp. MC2016-15]